MKTKTKIVIGALAVAFYYIVDSLVDFFIIHPGEFENYLMPSISSKEFYSRVVGITVIILLAWVMHFLNKKFPTMKASEDSLKSDTDPSLPDHMIPEMLAHQLKTSLTTIMGFSNLIKKGDISEKSRSLYNDYIFSSSENLLQTYKNLLEIQKLNNKQISLKSDKCQIFKILEGTLQKFSTGDSEFSKSNRELKLAVSENDRNLVMISDKDNLNMIFENLLQNAISFTKEGIIELGYHLNDANTITFFVRDSGKTVSLKKFEDAYQSFSKNPKGIDSSFDLAALRLIVAKEYVELLGGELWSTPNKRQGTTYNFTLPTIKKDDSKSSNGNNGELVPDWSSKTFLVAEDVETNFLLIKELLRLTKVKLVWAKNGNSALEYFRSDGNGFDAVLLDIIMPELDGFEVASEIRKTNQIIPIIGQTAYTLENDHDIGKLANFNDFLTKPIWHQDLINALLKYMD